MGSPLCRLILFGPLVFLGALAPSCERPSAPRGHTASRPAAAAPPASSPAPFRPSAEPPGLVDGLGRPISLDRPARRIVSLAPSNTEILFAIGAGGQLVGRDDNSDFPEEAARIPAVGATGGKLNRELLVALKPELVLAAEINSPEELNAMRDLGLKPFLLKNPVSFDQLFENLEVVGRLTGHQAEAAVRSAELRSRVETVKKALSGMTRRPLVFYEIDSTDSQRPWTVGPGSFMDMLIRLAGGENFGASFGRRFPKVSAEEVLARDPEVIVLGDGRFGVTVEALRRRPGWEELSAVKSGRIYTFNDDLASRPGPRLVEGLELLAQLLHPECAR
jgi:iron complex transport system substrate-binding protein